MQPEIVEPACPVTISESARAHIKRHLRLSDDGIGFYLGVKKSGCSGWMYFTQWVSDGESVDNALAVELGEEGSLYIQRDQMPLLAGTHIDLSVDGINRVLTFNNPNAAAACGCGESFTVSQLPRPEGRGLKEKS